MNAVEYALLTDGCCLQTFRIALRIRILTGNQFNQIKLSRLFGDIYHAPCSTVPFRIAAVGILS